MVSYIRILKPPKVISKKDIVVVKTVVTITSDLGDVFYADALSIHILLIGDFHLHKHAATWRAGMRALPIEFTVPMTYPAQPVRLLLTYEIDDESKSSPIPDVVNMWSQEFTLSHHSEGARRVERRFRMGEKELRIVEDTGESIARHVWDAGVALVSQMRYQEASSNVVSDILLGTDGLLIMALDEQLKGHDGFAKRCVHQALLLQYSRSLYDEDAVGLFFQRITTADDQAQKAFVDDVNSTYTRIKTRTAEIAAERTANPAGPESEKTAPRRMNVLELGGGCGLVGIAVAQFRENCHVLVTDLPEAMELLDLNISLAHAADGSALKSLPYDWNDEFPPQIAEQDWDLLIISDCTYNSDSSPSLVKTIKSFKTFNSKAAIIIGMKKRHASEAVFFDLMRDEGFIVVAKESVEMPDRVRTRIQQPLEVADIYSFDMKH